MRVVSRSRQGVGTVLGVVLILIGISLMIILGADVLGRGSRITMQRAFGVARAIQVGRLALDEAMTSPEYSDQFLVRIENLVETSATPILTALSGGGTAPAFSADPVRARDEKLMAFLSIIHPTAPGPSGDQILDDWRNVDLGGAEIPTLPESAGIEYLDIGKHPSLPDPSTGPDTGIVWISYGRGTTVAFGTGQTESVDPVNVRGIYQEEIDRGVLEIGAVKMRPVIFNCPSPVPALFEGEVGLGMARGMVRVRQGRSVRYVSCDRIFRLSRERVDPSDPTNLNFQWRIGGDKDPWQVTSSGSNDQYASLQE